MVNDRNFSFGYFTDKFSGGAFIFSGEEGHKLLYANKYLMDIFGCESEEEFYNYVGNSFDGMVDPTELLTVLSDMETQVKESQNDSGYVFYDIRTVDGEVRRVVNHITLVHDPELGDIYYGYIFLHKTNNVGADYDMITGLLRKHRFHTKVAAANARLCDVDSNEYSIIYLNLINFKFLNISKGISEGDSCLKNVARILRESFPDGMLSRLSDDHFAVFTQYNGALQNAENAAKKINDSYGGRFNVVGKFGIYRFVPNKYLDVESALSLAKFACDYIKNDIRTDIIEYSESLAERINTSEYVIKKLDEAIENDWIQIYFQPVVRTLTEQLCGMESLVRWDDPYLGFLRPDRFIGILEKDRQIHKLDSYVVERVCRMIHERMAENKPIVPVSINFSRLDFIMCDMLEVVEKAVEKYDIPRDYIHFEITESMIASDEELMRNVIDRFRNAGYEIWMDDFGSGYSSLTLLKDFQFDMLKLDMRFLTPFTDKAKDIVSATVTMAKNIGIGTLAEGVETKEHLEFLKEIGCGKIQGYYYGRPESIDDMFEHLKEKGISIEARKWRHFYETASFNVRLTDRPLEIIEDDGRKLRTLFMNKSYKKQIFDKDYDIEELNRRLYGDNSPILQKYREFARIVEESGKTSTFYYTDKGNYFSLDIKRLAEQDGHYILECSGMNLTMQQQKSVVDNLDSKLRELNYLFDEVTIINKEEGTIVPLFGGDSVGINQSDINMPFKKNTEDYVRDNIFPSERAACIEFFDIDTMAERIAAGGKGYISKSFRKKNSQGEYEWKELIMMSVTGSFGNEFLYCIKPFSTEACNFPVDSIHRNPNDQNPSSQEIEYAKIWNSLVWNSDIKLFWKDKNSRYRGVSQALMDYFGLKSMGDIFGKTNEEMGWNPKEDRARIDDANVLRKGEIIRGYRDQCLAKGVVHDVVGNKFPIYDDGEIIGLVGFFRESDKDASADGRNGRMSTDRVTGLMNANALMELMIDYSVNKSDKNKNYGLIVLNSSRHSRVIESYDEEFGNKVLKRLADTILNETGQNCAVARPKDAIFVILMTIDDPDRFYALGERVKKALEGINEVDGNHITIRIKKATVMRTDEGITDENMYSTALAKVR